MPRVGRSIVVRRPPAEAFAFLADFGNDARWRKNVVEMRALGSDAAPGGRWSRQVEVRRVPGKVVETEAVITTFEPPRRLAVRRASGPVRPEASYTLHADGAAVTRVDFVLDVRLAGAWWLAWPLVALLLNLVVRPVLRGDLERLRALLEADGPS